VHLSPHAVPNKLAHDAKAMALNALLDRPGDVHHPVSGASLTDALVQGAFGNIHQPLGKQVAAPSGHRSCVVADVTLVNHTHVHTDRIAKLDDPVAGNAVHDLFVDRNTGMARKPAIPEERAASPVKPDPLGRERQPYVTAALQGNEARAWFRSTLTGRAVVAVAQPVTVGGKIIGAVVLQQGTDAILSLTNEGLARLIYVTLITTIVVAGVLLGYATWLSRRIRALSLAAENALDKEQLDRALPSALADDELGDLSRSFSWVLQQLGEYNEYLRTLASKLSHELRTPLAIVTSSLENLEHEPLNEASLGYTARAREGADRLRNILNAMSEASRVEELMKNAEPERFDLRAVLESATDAYRDVYATRQFVFDAEVDTAKATGSPELLIQMLDKLVDNAVDFSSDGDTITMNLAGDEAMLVLSVANPGPPLPERMRSQLFDSMVSMREGKDSRHLGLGLYVAKLIAEGHGGNITADNIDGGVVFSVSIPRAA